MRTTTTTVNVVPIHHHRPDHSHPPANNLPLLCGKVPRLLVQHIFLWHSSRFHPWNIDANLALNCGASRPNHNALHARPNHIECNTNPGHINHGVSIMPRSQSHSAPSLQERRPGGPGNHLTSTCHPGARALTKDRELDISHFI